MATNPNRCSDTKQPHTIRRLAHRRNKRHTNHYNGSTLRHSPQPTQHHPSHNKSNTTTTKRPHTNRPNQQIKTTLSTPNRRTRRNSLQPHTLHGQHLRSQTQPKPIRIQTRHRQQNSISPSHRSRRASDRKRPRV